MAEGKNLVGVDIGASSIKVCQLKETRKGYSLVRLGYAELPPQAIVDGRVVKPSVVVDALGRALTSAKVKQREVALSISGQAVIIRKITVPLMTAAELEEQILWEAEQHIPFDIKDVHVDYEVLRRRPESGQMDLLLVAAKRDEVNEYVQIARAAKLKPLVVDVDAFTVQNVFELNRGIPADQTLAIINSGASLTSVNILARGASAFTRDIASAGTYVTEQLQRQLGVSFEQAEAFKLAASQGFVPVSERLPGARDLPPEVPQILETVSDSIAGEVQRSLDFFLATSGEPELQRIYLAGGSSNLTALAFALGRRARVPVEVIQPLERIHVETKEVDPTLASKLGGQLCVAVGLAMRKEAEKRA